MIRRLAIGLLLLPLLMVLGCEGDLPEGAIAQVGATPVSQDQFDKLMAAYEAAGRVPDEDKQPDEYRSFEQGLAEYLVIQEVLRQKAPSYDVTVTEGDVQNKLAQIKEMFQGDAEKFEAALEKQGMTLEQLTQSIRESLLLEEMKAAVTSDVTVTDGEAQAYYETHKSEYVEQESREVRHILISPFGTTTDGTTNTEASQAEWDAAKAEADKVRSEIQNGADFVSEAEKYSDDEATKETGGELGAVTRGVLVPAFEEAVFSLQEGELSQAVKTPYGYHLIEVTDITPEKQLSFDQVRENIKSTLLKDKVAETWEQWLASTEAELGVAYRTGYQPASAERDSTVDSLTELESE